MTLIEESIISKHEKTLRLYVTIPDEMSKDSSFCFVDGQKVELEYVPKSKALIIRQKP